VLDETHQLGFLEGSAGTGKIFTVKALINALQSHCKKCLICGTTGIAGVQYPGGTILHSLFRLGIDEQSRGVSVQISDAVLRWSGISLPLI
jgi:Cdc6-like AAA superfamily ATPase